MLSSWMVTSGYLLAYLYSIISSVMCYKYYLICLLALHSYRIETLCDMSFFVVRDDKYRDLHRLCVMISTAFHDLMSSIDLLYEYEECE